MKAISSTEFREKQKYYLDLAKKERLIIQRGKNEAFAIIPLEDLDETGYLFSSPANARRLREAIANIESGADQAKPMKIEDLWK
jgi:PHD/YefM family antitoxin component YafN of YafNO toxin-antitoxin module